MKKDDMSNANAQYGFENATGELEFQMKNDMLFHIVMQKNNDALTALVSSLLGMSKSQITSAHVENPIDFNKVSEGKEIILDLKVTINSSKILDVEIQVARYLTWCSRSVYYASRMIAEQRPNADYSGLKPVTQIGILDFPLFPDHREFFGRYKLINENDGYVYSNLLSILVLDLNAVDIAAKADMDNGLVYWAKMFKASTWNEIKRICEEYPEMKGAAQTMYSALSDKKTREALLVHEKKLMDEQAMLAYATNEGIEKGMAKGLKDGVVKGRESQARKTALNLAKTGMSPDQIASIIDFSLDKVRGWLDAEAAGTV